MFENTIEILTLALWTCLAVYITWYCTKAKSYAPISVEDARILWKIHRQNIRCNARKWREIRRGGKVIGFECECGYKHVQNRPIVSNLPEVKIDQRSDILHNISSSRKTH